MQNFSNMQEDARALHGMDKFSFSLESSAAKAFGVDCKYMKITCEEESLEQLKESFYNIDPKLEYIKKTSQNFLIILALPKILVNLPNCEELQRIQLLVKSLRVNAAPGIETSEIGKKLNMIASVLPIILICKAQAYCKSEQQELTKALDQNIEQTLKHIHNLTRLTKDKFTSNPKSIRDWILEVLENYSSLEINKLEKESFKNLIQKLSKQKTYDLIVHTPERSHYFESDFDISDLMSELEDEYFDELGKFKDQKTENLNGIIRDLAEDLKRILFAQKSVFDAKLTAFDRLELDYQQSSKSNLCFWISPLIDKFYNKFFESFFDSEILKDKRYLLINFEILPEFKRFYTLMLGMRGVNYELLKKQINDYFNNNRSEIDDFRIFLGCRLESKAVERDFSTILNDSTTRSLFGKLDHLKKMQLKLSSSPKIIIFDQEQRYSLIQSADQVALLDVNLGSIFEMNLGPNVRDNFYSIKVECNYETSQTRIFDTLANIIGLIEKSDAIEFLKFRDPILIDKIKIYDKLIMKATDIRAELYRRNIATKSVDPSRIKNLYESALYFISRDDDQKDEDDIQTPNPCESIDSDYSKLRILIK